MGTVISVSSELEDLNYSVSDSDNDQNERSSCTIVASSEAANSVDSTLMRRIHYLKIKSFLTPILVKLLK